jgi:long-chain acyl-CoA synthetase
LQTSIEQQFSLELPDDALAALETLGELRAILAEQAAPGEASDHAAKTLTDAQPLQSSEVKPPQDAPETPPATAPVPEPAENRPPAAQTTSRANDDLRALTSDSLYPRWPWSGPFAAARIVFLELLMRPLVWFLGAPRVVRRSGEIPPGPMLIIANHVTAYDGALILYALPARLRRHVAIAMLGEMLLDYRRGRNQPNALLNLLAPPQYWLVTALFNVFPMPRLHGFQRSFMHAGEAMDRGYSVMVFPEGARNFDAILRPFRKGIGLLAQQSLVPILPVALVGLDEIVRQEATRMTAWFRSGQLEIRIGELIPVDPDAEPAQLTAKLEQAIRDLLA